MISVYNYQNPIHYLSDYLKTEQGNENFTLKKWSREAGFESTAAIVDVLKGKKNLSPNMINGLIGKIGLDQSEYSYFMTLIAKTKGTSELENNLYDMFLNELTPKNQNDFSCKRFTNSDVFSHWIYTTILSLGALKSFELTATNIKENLKEELSLEFIESAIDRLMEIQLLEIHEGKIQAKYQSVTTKTDVKSEDSKNYFLQMADLSKKGIETLIDQREYQSFSIPMDTKKIPLAKEIIRKCRANLAALSDKEGNSVYQMNMSLFPLTNKELN